jgi:hypothetical protein
MGFCRTARNGKRERAFNPHKPHGPYARRSYRTARESWAGFRTSRLETAR